MDVFSLFGDFLLFKTTAEMMTLRENSTRVLRTGAEKKSLESDTCCYEGARVLEKDIGRDKGKGKASEMGNRLVRSGR